MKRALVAVIGLLAACPGRSPHPLDEDAGVSDDAGVDDDAGIDDDDDDDAGVDDDADAGVLDADPPPGGSCGRSWRTFDPRRVYLLAEVPGGGCGVVGFDDVAAWAGVIACDPPGVAAVRPGDGRLVYVARDPVLSARVFTPDARDDPVGDRACAPVIVPTLNDARVATPACDVVPNNGRLLDFRLQPDGGYAYRCADGWYDDDGRALAALDGRVVAGFNVDGDALAVAPRSRIVRAGGEVVFVAGLPEDLLPESSETSTRADGRAFRVPVATQSGALALYVVDADGAAHSVAVYDVPERYDVNRRDWRLLDDDALVAPAFDGADVILRLVPGGGVEELYREGGGPVRLSSTRLVTGP